MVNKSQPSARLSSTKTAVGRKAMPGATTTRAGTTSVRTKTGQERQTASGEGPVKPRGLSRSKGLGLRSKFMLVLAGMTALAMALLGFSMAKTTNMFLFSQKQHGGVEIARMAAQLGVAVSLDLQRDFRKLADEITAGTADPSDRIKLINDAEARLVRGLESAREWSSGKSEYSDIVAIRFEGGDISGFGIGEREIGGAGVGTQYPTLYIPKFGKDLALPSNIQVYAAQAKVQGKTIPIYRFKIRFDQAGIDPTANVRVDIAAQAVESARSNLYAIIAIAVLAGIGVVVFVANWLAGNITKPVDLLLKDMQIVARGDLNHQTKPHSRDEIGVLAHEFNKMTNNLQAAQSALVEQEKAEYELSLAREVQRQLLPAEAPQIEGYDSAAFYQGAKAVSGDYFDIIPLGNGLWGFIVADVSGKGIPGSMVMAVTRTIVRLVANKHQARAAETLKETNRLIAKQIKRGMFVTAFYAILDQSTGVVTYSSAGHNPMIVYRAATKSYELATTKGIAIGFNEGPIFDKTIQEARLTLGHNDSILLYTDGFPEAMNDKNEEFGEERFYKTAAHFGHLDSRALLASLVQEVARHRGQAEQSDDLTIITVHRTT